MISRKSKAIVGLFVLGAIALVCAATIMLGSGSWNYQKTSFVLYFNSTLRGLTVGSSVYYNGVRVGKVTSLEISPQSGDIGFSTPVIIELEMAPQIVEDDNIPDLVDYMSNPKTFDALVENGLRAKLSTLSFITGLLVIDLVMDPHTQPVDPKSLAKYHGIPQIPTISSGLDSVLSEFSEIPFNKIASQASHTLENINNLLEQIDLKLLSDKAIVTLDTANATMLEYSKLAQNINQNVDALMKNADSTMVQADEVLRSLDKLADNGTTMLSGNSAFMQDLSLTMMSIRHAADAINDVAKLLERKPDAFIFGKGN